MFKRSSESTYLDRRFVREVVRDPIKTKSSNFLLFNLGSEFGGSSTLINKIRRASYPSAW